MFHWLSEWAACLFLEGFQIGDFFFLPLFPSEIKIFLQELPVGFVIPPTCLLQDGCAHWGALTGGAERMVRVKRVENSRNILELQGIGMLFLCWVQHTRCQVTAQDPRAGQEQFDVKSFSLNIPGEAGMSKTPARTSSISISPCFPAFPCLVPNQGGDGWTSFPIWSRTTSLARPQCLAAPLNEPQMVLLQKVHLHQVLMAWKQEFPSSTSFSSC